jgi:acylphosphatase
MKSRLHLKIYGIVQGVFFRATTQDQVRKIGGITGFVKNLPDGSVELVAEGEKDKLEQLLDWAKHGPASAQVEKIDEKWEEYRGEFVGFEIRYS